MAAAGGGGGQAFSDAYNGRSQGYGYSSRPAGQSTTGSRSADDCPAWHMHARRGGWRGRSRQCDTRSLLAARTGSLQDICIRVGAEGMLWSKCGMRPDPSRCQRPATQEAFQAAARPACRHASHQGDDLEASSALTCTVSRAPSLAASDALPARQGLTKMRGGCGKSSGRVGCTERAAEAAAAVLVHCAQLPAAAHADPRSRRLRRSLRTALHPATAAAVRHAFDACVGSNGSAMPRLRQHPMASTARTIPRSGTAASTNTQNTRRIRPDALSLYRPP